METYILHINKSVHKHSVKSMPAKKNIENIETTLFTWVLTCWIWIHRFGLGLFKVFNATFNNISVISWRSVLLEEETSVPGENHRTVASHRQTFIIT